MRRSHSALPGSFRTREDSRRSLLDRWRRDEGRGRMSLVARLFRLPEHHMVVARGPNCFALQPAESTHIGDELPHLIVGDFSAEGRHAVGSALRYRCEDVLRITAVDPLVVSQRRPNSAAAMRVATGAVHLIEQYLAFGDGVGVVLVWIADPRLDDGWPGLERAHHHCVRGGSRWRRLSKTPLLALAPQQARRDDRRQ